MRGAATGDGGAGGGAPVEGAAATGTGAAHGTGAGAGTVGSAGAVGGLSAALVRAREAACLTQGELAHRSGLSVRAIRNLETGQTARPRKQSLLLLAEALGLPPGEAGRLLRLPRTEQRGAAQGGAGAQGGAVAQGGVVPSGGATPTGASAPPGAPAPPCAQTPPSVSTPPCVAVPPGTAAESPEMSAPPGVPTPPGIPAPPGVPAQPDIPAIPATPGVLAPPGTPAPPGVPAPPYAPAPGSGSAPPTLPAPPALPVPPIQPTPPALPAPPPPAVPAELPAAPRHRLVGREVVAGELMAHLARRDPGPGRPAAVVVGPPGAGKTALVLRAAHGVREHFPDGQVFVDLHPANARPVPPDVLVRRVLRSLGGAPAAEHPEESRAQLRNALGRRRVLVVLDNVDNEAQVRPLLVADGRSAVLVAARRELSALPERFRRRIGALEEHDALRALTDLVGAERVGAERPAALSIVRSCAGLPLAVHIAGLWLTARPHRRVRDLADRLADERDRLAVLRIGNLSLHASVAAYLRLLSPQSRTALRRLARSPDDFGIPETPAGAPPSPGPAADLLEELLHRQLIHPVPAARQGGTRYRLYDAVRLHAAEDAVRPHAAEAARRAPSRRLRPGRAPGR